MPSAKCQFCALNTFRENVWTNRQTNKQTNKQTREPLSKGDSRTGLIAFHIQPPIATLASLTHIILHTSE